ncbi:MAG: 2-dehydro-3-deoxygalactonokinase, partial [Paracoccaceae bacterium]
GLINNLSAEAARARLSGYLIGLELAGAKPYWLGQDLVVIGAPNLSALYARALAVQGLPSRVQSGDDMTLEGLKAAYHALKEARE